MSSDAGFRRFDMQPNADVPMCTLRHGDTRQLQNNAKIRPDVRDQWLCKSAGRDNEKRPQTPGGLGNTQVWGEIFSASSGAPSDKSANRFVL
jgi:hypothetical protein